MQMNSTSYRSELAPQATTTMQEGLEGSVLNSGTKWARLLPVSFLAGYDYEFVPSLDNKHMCPICLLALRDPVQTECGHRFCQPCISRSLEWVVCLDIQPATLALVLITYAFRHQKKCPVDNDPLTTNQLFQDKYAHREVLDLKVKCNNKGCDFVSELRLIEV